MELHIISRINRLMESRHISKAALARMIGVNATGVTIMLKGSTLQVQRLAEISESLKYNFFREIASELPFSEPEDVVITGLQNKVRDLELEVNILRQTLRELLGR